MKVYISADIEGVTGVTVWDEAKLHKPDHKIAQEQMTAEVRAACEGALNAGATEIWVKDAHDSGRNLIASQLPPEVKLIRGWSGHPYMMLQELDETFDGIVLIGYHSGSGTAANPLSHTLMTGVVDIRVNDHQASEFILNGYTAAMLKVPIVFVSGDKGLCDEVHNFVSGIRTVAVKEGIGESTISIHPDVAVNRIREEVTLALQAKPACRSIDLPPNFTVEIRYKDHYNAYRNAFYPGAKLTAPYVVEFEADNYFEVLRFLLFVA
ncbi:MAG: M55 family metallopeptidase [Desulfobacterales bacterium]|nr:M55 family metallopeptidase [Desulfobacterales bacterium]